MNKLLFFIYSLFPLLISSRLVSVLSIHRHGARSSGKFYSPSFFSVGKKQLTETGAQQMRSLGDYYKSKYCGHLFSPNFSFIPVIYSSPVMRCIESAENLVQGMFPEISWNKKIIFEETVIDSWGDIPLNQGQMNQFPIFIQNRSNDFLFHGFKESVCPKAHILKQISAKSKLANSRLPVLRKKLFPSLSKYLNDTLGIFIAPETMSMVQMKAIYDLYIATKTEGIETIGKLKDHEIRMLERDRRHFVEHKLGDEEVIKLCTTQFFRLLREVFSQGKDKFVKDSIRGSGQGKENLLNFDGFYLNPSFVILSGHDTVMNLILYALFGKDERKVFGDKLEMRFASHLDFELIFEENTEKFKVEILVNGINMKNYEMEELENLMDKFNVKNLESACKLKKKE